MKKLGALRSLQRAKYIDYLIEQEDKVPIEDLVDDLGLSLEMTKEVLKEIQQDHDDALLKERDYNFIQTPDLEVVGLIETGPLTALKEKIRKIRKSSGTGLDEDTKQLLEITGRIADVAYRGLRSAR